MNSVRDKKFLKKRYMQMLKDEIFLSGFVEVLESAGDRQGASLVREKLYELRNSRLQLKELIS
ncbi:hypothetical protein [Corallococcus sp. AB032C]|uniref:hypothetical protein n=1 Tax=Corallococcus sp. AB032C TaxID=2316717 RepID=UPI0011C40041|nr:hypothetical protein [Corallococcus sp. AB032C]